MIVVTRLNGLEFGVNPDLIQRIDATPDTVLTLIDGTKLLVEEPLSVVIGLIHEQRAHLLARAQEIHDEAPAPTIELVPSPHDDKRGDGQITEPVQLRPRSR